VTFSVDSYSSLADRFIHTNCHQEALQDLYIARRTANFGLTNAA
jgi:hypothetical protein